jgi:mono/diheme cytochrome c family protein
MSYASSIRGSLMKQAYLFASIAAASVLLSATALAETDKKTERLWKAQCASCHGQGGMGDTGPGKAMKVQDMSTAAFQAKKDDELKKAIVSGVKTEQGGVKQEMDAFKDLTPEQVDSLIALIRSFKK